MDTLEPEPAYRTPQLSPETPQESPKATGRHLDDTRVDIFEAHDSSAEGPPPLRYPIESKTKALVLICSVIIFVNSIVPVTIFYTLRNVLHSSTNFILNMSQLPMTPIIFQFPYRLWQLKRRKGERSPRDRGRLTWDSFQWQFLFNGLVLTTLYAVSNVLDSYILFALAAPIMFTEIGLQLLLFDILAIWKVPQPCRISSVPKGAPFRPGIYYCIDDLTAVDGGGGAEYRDRLNERWNASLRFRILVRDVGRIIGGSSLLMVGVELAIVLVTPAEVFMSVSWAVLWTWGALSAYFCVFYTKTCLAEERARWKSEA